MADDGAAIPLWKRNLEKAWAVNAAGTAKGAAGEARRAKKSVQEALMNAFDKLGNEAFFLRLAHGTAEDRRCFAMILAKLLPLQVEGHLDHSLVVKVVKQVGHREIVIEGGPSAHFGRPPKDAVTGKALPVAPALDGVPEVLAYDEVKP